VNDHDIDWNGIRGAPWEDDAPDRAELIAELEGLRREVADARRMPERSSTQQSPSIVSGDLRRLAEKIDAISSRLPSLLVPIPDAAAALGVSVSTVRRGIKSGDLPHRKIGRSVRVDLSACKGLDANDIAQLARKARSGR
jgi:excisionase family DNA binding protein